MTGTDHGERIAVATAVMAQVVAEMLRAEIHEQLTLVLRDAVNGHAASGSKPAAPASVESPWLTIHLAADYCHMDYRVIAAACRDGSLRAEQKVRKGKWLIHRDSLDAWIRS